MAKRHELVNKVVVLTGASAGVRRATALAFAREGARIALIARNVPRLQSLHGEIALQGTEALAISLDVADAAKVELAA